MQHPDEGTIHSWLDGALSADEAARVEAHVKECAQCQAAVAEARGFIAASSRILTALDNAPRGVLPAATPKKRDRMAAWVSGFRPADPMVWRIAATVLVVAAGTLVVVRNSGVETPSSERLQATAGKPIQLDSGPRDISETAASSAAAGTIAQALPASPQEDNVAVSKLPRGGVLRSPQISGGVASAESRADRSGAQKSATIQGNAELQQRGSAAIAAAPAPPSPVPATAPPRRFESVERRAGNVVAMDAAAEEPGVRIVGTPRAIGQKITLYEVAPGDTVQLAESLSVALEQVVTTGLSSVREQAGQAKAATGRAAPAAKVAAPSPGGTNTIAWTDSTGRRMRLSGRHTPAELEGIRRRIERSQMAAADSAKKNR